MDALPFETASNVDAPSIDDGKARALPVAFALQTASAGPMTCRGVLRELEHGAADTLTTRVARFFAQRTDGPAFLVGALPFEREGADLLFQPATVAAEPLAGGAPLPTEWRARAEPNAATYQAEVKTALKRIAKNPKALSKVVLSRSLVLSADGPVDPLSLLARLAGDANVARFMTPVGKGRHLVGATPELLVSKTGGSIVSHPLAGSARRSANAAMDSARADGLMNSEKDRREHAWVVEAIMDALAPYCAELAAPEPSLYSTRTMWHLGTRIEGRLKDASTPSIELAAALHPTPAVGGFPREAAYRAIRDIEAYDRGFYAGAVGYTAENGDGAWYIALRCAEVAANTVRLFAGAGIVPGSDPAEEAAETSAKFQTLLSALGVDESGRAQDFAGK